MMNPKQFVSRLLVFCGGDLKYFFYSSNYSINLEYRKWRRKNHHSWAGSSRQPRQQHSRKQCLCRRREPSTAPHQRIFWDWTAPTMAYRHWRVQSGKNSTWGTNSRNCWRSTLRSKPKRKNMLKWSKQPLSKWRMHPQLANTDCLLIQSSWWITIWRWRQGNSCALCSTLSTKLMLTIRSTMK